MERTRLAYAQDAAGRGWDRIWRLVAFAIPEAKRAARDAFRDHLLDLGGAAIQNGLYVSPHRWDADVLAEAERLEVGRARDAGVHQRARDRRQPRSPGDRRAPVAPRTRSRPATRRFVDVYDGVPEQLERMRRNHERLAEADFLPGALVIGIKFQECFNADPLLPPELLPRPWPGRRARELLARSRRLGILVREQHNRPALFAPYDDIALMLGGVWRSDAATVCTTAVHRIDLRPPMVLAGAGRRSSPSRAARPGRRVAAATTSTRATRRHPGGPSPGRADRASPRSSCKDGLVSPGHRRPVAPTDPLGHRAAHAHRRPRRRRPGGRAVQRSVAKTVVIDNMTQTGHVVTVDLGRKFESANTRPQVGQVVYTLTQFPGVTAVQFLIDGQPNGASGVPPESRADLADMTPAVLPLSPAPADRLGHHLRLPGPDPAHGPDRPARCSPPAATGVATTVAPAAPRPRPPPPCSVSAALDRHPARSSSTRWSRPRTGATDRPPSWSARPARADVPLAARGRGVPG